MADENRNNWRMKLHLCAAGLGIAAGASVFFVFTFQYGNYHAGFWSLLSMILASIVLHHHLLYKNYRLEQWHTVHSITALRNLGLLTFLGGLGACIYYFYTVASEHQPLYPLSDSWLIAGVWSFMTVKWSVATVYFSQKYKTILDREYTLF